MQQISENKHGFLSQSSCEGAIGGFLEYIEEKRPTFAAFVDFKPAFDNENRKKLIHTFSMKFGMTGKIIQVLRSILRPNTQGSAARRLHIPLLFVIL